MANLHVKKISISTLYFTLKKIITSINIWYSLFQKIKTWKVHIAKDMHNVSELGGVAVVMDILIYHMFSKVVEGLISESKDDLNNIFATSEKSKWNTTESQN